MQQQHLRRRAAGPGAEQPGVAHPGGVEDEEVAGGNESEQVGEGSIGHRRRAVTRDHEQPAGTALRTGLLRDQGGGERVVEVGGAEGHRAVGRLGSLAVGGGPPRIEASLP